MPIEVWGEPEGSREIESARLGCKGCGGELYHVDHHGQEIRMTCAGCGALGLTVEVRDTVVGVATGRKRPGPN